MGYPRVVSTSSRRFELKHCLGRGSFGEVYAATMQSAGGLRTTVAIKLLRSDIALANQALRRLSDEGRLLARLNHPAIVRVYDLIRLNGRLALITELIDGEDLSELITANPMLPLRPLLQVMSQIAGALAAALDTVSLEGSQRLVHRDVKPSNIRIDRHGQAKLLDFGVARFDASDREVRTASDLIVGSIPFMAPERFVQREVAPSSDIFSLGCTLYQGISSQRFYGTNRVAAITAMAIKPKRYQAHLAERLQLLRTDPAVRDVVEAMLLPQADARPTAAEAARLLEELAENVPGPTLRMWCRDRTWPDRAALKGSLDGRVLFEGELEQVEQEPSSTPQVNLEPRPTLQPIVPSEGMQPLAQNLVQRTFDEEPTASPPVLPTLVPAPDADNLGDQTPVIPEREIATVLRPPRPDTPPSVTLEPPEDNLWILVLAFVGFSVALGLAIFVGFAVFTALMMA